MVATWRSLLFFVAIVLVIGAGLFSATANMPVGPEVHSRVFPCLPNTCVVALIKPTFTSTAYGNVSTWPNSFYSFYQDNVQYHEVNDSRQLTLLKSQVIDGWATSYHLKAMLENSSTAFHLGKNVFVLTDEDVSQGGLFFQGKWRYNAIILGHNEYVTRSEYEYLRYFVADGGKLILADANALYTEVAYNPKTGVLHLVSGHGWQFNGTSAWQNSTAPFHKDEINWLGSAYGHYEPDGAREFNGTIVNTSSPIGMALSSKFGDRVFAGYSRGEEDCLLNMTETKVIATFVPLQKLPCTVAAFVHEYGRGEVYSLGIFSDYALTDPSIAAFIEEALQS